jgi:hypothetical protein
LLSVIMVAWKRLRDVGAPRATAKPKCTVGLKAPIDYLAIHVNLLW